MLPSGRALSLPLETASAGVTYGRLLFGGVTRYRLLPGGMGAAGKGPGAARRRRVGERREVTATSAGGGAAAGPPSSWAQFGGTERMYEAVDMGPACLIEVTILPPQASLRPLRSADGGDGGMDAAAYRVPWDADSVFERRNARDGDGISSGRDDDASVPDGPPRNLIGKDRNDAIASEIGRRVAGLGPQIDEIVRRVLDGRAIYPTSVSSEADLTEGGAAAAAEGGARSEARELSSLGLGPVRGVLLYGPPGCGKTALALGVSSALRRSREGPRLISAPELLDRWVGGTEGLIRDLFAGAEAELAACRGDPTRSGLHVIVIDEIDAVFRRRGASSDGGEATRASAVNQILSKLDGVEAIPNILVIGMTNRRELLDEALLRPGV